jgi:two-component system LytT family response regulator
LIIRTDCVPSSYCNIPGSAEFQVIIGLHAKNGAAFACAFETLELPFDAPTLRSTMERARTEIYRRKLDEISTLLRRYMDSSVGVDRFMTALKVDDGNYAEIPAENVVFMAADGNYVRLHTDANIHEVRETMAGMTSKLDPARFARVHRSFIVNRACVSCVLRKEGAATAVLLHNGIEIPVGPNYRTEVDSFENYSRLSA